MYDYENQAYLEKLNSKPAVWFEDVLQQVGAAASEKVLELGCGDGALSRLLAASGRDVLSVDYSQTFINHAKKYNKVKKQLLPAFQSGQTACHGTGW
jgi:2-polyprenyl-3-methyl-5-hydroxy-6-metoxy-1,4-benzoquinol methylase